MTARKERLVNALERFLYTLSEFGFLDNTLHLEIYGSFLAKDEPEDIDVIAWGTEDDDFQHSYGVDIHFKDRKSYANNLWARSLRVATAERYGSLGSILLRIPRTAEGYCL